MTWPGLWAASADESPALSAWLMTWARRVAAPGRRAAAARTPLSGSGTEARIERSLIASDPEQARFRRHDVDTIAGCRRGPSLRAKFWSEPR